MFTSMRGVRDTCRSTRFGPVRRNRDVGFACHVGRRMTSRLGWRMRMKRALAIIRRRVPAGLRLVLGLVLIGGGALGFLPILGFWMIPLGVAVAALDIMPLWRRLFGR